MDLNYDLFEMLTDGSPIWRGTANGSEEALRKLDELAKQTPNELRAIHVPTSTVLAAVNKKKA